MAGVDVPSYFLCPISLAIMRDPVALPTGITYDRESIERWLFSDKHTTCPMTMQQLRPDADLTPNHVLRRLIQSWCVANSVERLPTPRAPVDRATILRILADCEGSRPRVESLRELGDVVACSDRNRRCADSVGAAKVLVAVLRNCVTGGGTGVSVAPAGAVVDEEEEESRRVAACDEALHVLHSLQMTNESLCDLATKNVDLVGLLTEVLRQRCSNQRSRTYATFLLKSILKTLSPVCMTDFDDGLFVEIVRVLGDRISRDATKAALRVLGELCPWGRNKVKAAEAGAVGVLVELLLDVDWEKPSRNVSEMIMIVLDQLCGCAEGRQELLRHGAGIAVVAKMIARDSATATDRGVRTLYAVARFSATPAVLEKMVGLGVVSKLCLVLHHADCGPKTKERAKEMLRLHARAWKDSPCLAPQFRSLYP